MNPVSGGDTPAPSKPGKRSRKDIAERVDIITTDKVLLIPARLAEAAAELGPERS
jgi:hypothetical protein